VAVLCAIFLVGGLGYWWGKPLKPPHRSGAGSTDEYAFAPETQPMPEAELAPKDDATLAEEQQRFTVTCYVIGYNVDAKGGIISLALATKRDDAFVFAGI